MCPNCGHAELSYHCGYSGDGWNEERIWEEWLICEKCGARTTNEELDRIGVDEPSHDDDLVETLWLIGTGKTLRQWRIPKGSRIESPLETILENVKDEPEYKK